MFEKLMFKKVEFWVVALLAVTWMIVTILFGYAVWYNSQVSTTLGGFTSTMADIAEAPHNVVKATKTLVLGNSELMVEDRFPEIDQFVFSDFAGQDQELGYLALNRYNGDIGRFVTELIDLDARSKIHTWTYDVSSIWASLENFESSLVNVYVDSPTGRFLGRHALPTGDGGIVIKGMSPLLSFDACSRLKWFQDTDVFHHSLEVDHEGNFWAPTYIEPKSVKMGDENFFYDDGITKISPDGEVLLQKSVISILEENGLGALLYGQGRSINPDPIHLNDIQPVMQDGPVWKKGDLFLSLRHQSMVLLYRPHSNEILWYKIGPWIHQHDVDVLDDKRIAVFNNNTLTRGDGIEYVKDSNEEIIFDFETQTVSSPFRSAFLQHAVATPTEGLAEFVDDETLFVEETDFGQLIQFDQYGRIVWQYINRAENGKVYRVAWSRIISRSFGDRVKAAVNNIDCND